MVEQSDNRLGGSTLLTTCNQIEVTISLPLRDPIVLQNGEPNMVGGACGEQRYL